MYAYMYACMYMCIICALLYVSVCVLYRVSLELMDQTVEDIVIIIYCVGKYGIKWGVEAQTQEGDTKRMFIDSVIDKYYA